MKAQLETALDDQSKRIDRLLDASRQLDAELRDARQKALDRELLKEARTCHGTFRTTPYENGKDQNPEAVNGTCQMVLTA
jgi:hypothetical protein